MALRIALLILKKDFLIEVKSLEILSTTLFFAVSCLLVFSFAFVKEGAPVQDAAAGILWIAISFSGTLALGRIFERERYGETLRALLLAPAPRPAIYLGKLLGMILLMISTEVVLVPMVAGGIAYFLVARGQSRDVNYIPIEAQVFPPALRLRSGGSLDEYFDNAGRMKAEADGKRRAMPEEDTDEF